MIPKVATRGHSFKGAGQYYLHDKDKAQTSDRVGWTHIHNINTSDPEKAMKCMAYTASNANKLKQEMGVKATGRKTSAGAVYSYSLAWHPSEQPEQKTMLDSAFETLERLGLKDHQAVIVQHQETDHPHVHVVVNLVNPQNGKTAVMSCDRLALSEWAQEYEQKHGIHCEKRIENNQKRKELSNDNDKSGFVKHKENKAERAEKIQALYNACENGQAFANALKKEGYEIAQGKSRGFVLVDDTGKIHSLSRQLKGQRAKDIKARLVDLKDLPDAKILAEDKQYFDRDKQNQEQQERIEKAGIEHEKKKMQAEKERKKQAMKAKKRLPFPANDEREGSPSQPTPQNKKDLKEGNKKDKPKIVKPFHIRHDRISAWEDWADDKREKLKVHQRKVYKRTEHLKKIKVLEKAIVANDNILGRMSGKFQGFKDELESEKLTLENVDSRIKEQTDALEKKIAQTKPQDYWGEQDNKPSPAIDLEQKKQSRDLSDKKQPPDKDQKRGYNLDR